MSLLYLIFSMLSQHAVLYPSSVIFLLTDVWSIAGIDPSLRQNSASNSWISSSSLYRRLVRWADRRQSQGRERPPPARVLFGFWWFCWRCLSRSTHTQGGGHWTVRCWGLSLSINIWLSRDHGGNKNEWIMIYNSMSIVWGIRMRCLKFSLAILYQKLTFYYFFFRFRWHWIR